MAGYQELEVWKLSHDMRLAIYRVTARYPTNERFSLVDQTRRAATSVATNIAEGSGRGSSRDYVRFLGYAMGSANEAEDQLLLARDLGYLDPSAWEALNADLVRIKSMLARLRAYLRSTIARGR